MTKKILDRLTYEVIGCAIEVHRTIGPGLLERIYHDCLIHEFNIRGIEFDSNMKIPINYKGINMNADLRCDFFVKKAIVVEIKSVAEILPIYEAQLLTYMKLLKSPKGILINFNSVNIFRDGQKTYVNEIFRDLAD